MDVLSTSATALRERLRGRELSALDLLEATLARIEAVNGAVNAVVAIDRDGARAAASDSDRRLAAGEGRPLEGLPITIKDAFDVKGLVSTAGAPAYRDRVPEADAAAVARLRQAGAVILGKSNVPAFCGDFQAFNAIHGTTNNPYDLARSPGGSSGGAAAAVASGMSAFELGSDFGGSIRWPAHACGLFGLKPTWGVVSTLGHVPPPPGTAQESDFTVAGPLARSAADLDLVLEAIAGPPALDGVRPRLEPPARARPRGLKVALWPDDPFAPVDRTVRAAVEEAASLLEGTGAEIDPSARPAFAFAEEFETFGLFNHAIIAAGLPAELRERIAARAGEFAADDRSHPALQARGAGLSPETWRELEERRTRFRRAWAAFFQEFDVLLCPPAPCPAIPHDHNRDFHARRLSVSGGERPYFDLLIWSSLATLGSLPAAVAPVTRTDAGLPVGVQIVAREGADRTAIAVAGMLEELGCGFTPPALSALPEGERSTREATG